MSDYNSLLADIPLWAENQDPELLAVLPSVIASAQERAYRDIDAHALETSIEGVINPGDTDIPKPDDLIVPRYFYVLVPDAVNGGTTKKMLPMKELEYLFEYWPNSSLRGTPYYYAIDDADHYAFVPPADAAYPYTLGYKQRLPQLSTAAPSNWLTDKCYDILLAACLAEVGRFVLDARQASMIAMWETKYNFLVKALNAVERRAERDDYRVPYVQTANVGGLGTAAQEQ